MNRIYLVSAVLIIILLGCKPSPKEEMWHCTQQIQMSTSWIGTSDSTSVIHDGIYGESIAKVIVRDTTSNKVSALQSKVTFDFLKEGNSVKQTLKTVDWEVISDELDIFSDGNASKLFPDIGTTLHGTQELTENGIVKTTYDSGLTTECTVVEKSAL